MDWNDGAVTFIPPETENITVDIVGGKPYVWKSDDVMALRKLHLFGTLIGSLPRKPWQNSVNALPALLLPEEVTLLKQLGRLTLRVQGSTTIEPEEEQRSKVKEHRKRLSCDQIKAFVIERNKKRRLYAQTARVSVNLAADNKQNFALSGCDMNLVKGASITTPPSDKTINKEASHNEVEHLSDDDVVTDDDKQYYRNSTWILVPTHYKGDTCENNAAWAYPSSKTDKMRFSVFNDLWKRGYYIATAEKFGGDYLVYPDDPQRFHSFYIMHVKSKTAAYLCQDLVSFARLGSSVKKTVVFATVDTENNFEVTYKSLSWAGFN